MLQTLAMLSVGRPFAVVALAALLASARALAAPAAPAAPESAPFSTDSAAPVAQAAPAAGEMPVAPPPPVAALPPVAAPEVAQVPLAEPARWSRPRMSVAVGMGGTFDSVGFADGATHLIPAFFAQAGIGDGLLGLDFGAFASSASGRCFSADKLAPATCHTGDQTMAALDRLALDLFGVVRPAGRFRVDDRRYAMRVLHALAAELGVGVERAGHTTSSAIRVAVHTGARFDLPLTPALSPTELRLRFGFRRDFGLAQPTVQGAGGGMLTTVGDSAAEVYGALVVLF